jgi:hypothetical protein
VVVSVTRERWTIVVPGASFAFAIIAGSLAASPDAWLVLAIGLGLVVALPGVRLMRTAR